MKKNIAAIIFIMALFPALAMGADIEGIYDCKGKNPGGGGEYAGTVSVAKNGATYNVNWTIGAQVYLGVGLLSGDLLSVGYSDTSKSWFGIVVYTVKGDKLDGRWSMHGGNKTGTETLTRRKTK
jgi:hypothetical protein